MRAVVFVTSQMRKGTKRSPQEYVNPLLVLTGDEYNAVPFGELHERICSTLRGERPRLVAQFLKPDGTLMLHFEDGSSEEIGELPDE